MADEIIVKVRADLDGFSADMQEAKKIGNSAIQDIEKNDLFAKASANAKDLKESLKLIAKASGDIRLDNFNVDEVVNDTQKLKKLIESLNQSLKGMKAGTTEFNSLDAIIKSANVQLQYLNVTTEKTGKSLRTQMREAQLEVATLSEKFGATSKQAIEAAKNAALLRDKLGDAKALTDAFNPDAKFSALSKSITGLASGFSAVQGAMGLLDSESADVQKTLLKVQSALALSQGLQGLGEAKDSFIQLKAVALDAFKGIRTAIGTTGIGLLVVALGTIVAYWDDIKEAVSGVSAEQRNLLIEAQKGLSVSKTKLEILNAQESSLKLQGVTEREIILMKLKAAVDNAKNEKEVLELRRSIEDTEIRTSKEREKSIQRYLGFLGTMINDISKGNFSKEAQDKAKKQEELAAKERKNARELEDAKILKQKADLELQLKELDNKTDQEAAKKQKEAKDKRDKEAKELLEREQKYAKDLDKFKIEQFEKESKIKQDAFDATLSQEKIEQRAVEEKYFNLIETAKQYNLDTTALEAKKTAELKAINDKYRKEENEAEQKQLDYQNSVNAISYKNWKEFEDKKIKEQLEKQKKLVDELLTFAENGILLQIGLNPQDVERVKSTVDSFIKSLNDKNASPEERFAKGAEAAQAAYQTVSGAIFAADTQRREQEMAALQAQKDEEIRLAGDNEQKKEVIRQKYALKEKEIKRKQAEADKKKAIMDATIKTAVAVVNAIAQSPLTLGMPWAAIVAGLGAAEIAMIAATPIPKFAKGGQISGGLLEGRPHSAGGILVEAEGKEYITNKEQSMSNLGLLEAINMSDSDRDNYINRHYVMPALQSKEAKANENRRNLQIETENNLIARVSSHTLKSIHREQKNTTEAIKRLDKKDFKW